jgi:integrator complex subunit 1
VIDFLETRKRKQILKESQKAIMLWDPDGPARKPPKESIEFLQAAVESFGLSLTLQKSVEPDFLLMTIGATSRDSIERSHDWLIPVISRVPDAVRRLPSNAACFLLLRAYGTEGQQRKQLKALSAPLLTNVQESLRGTFGEDGAIRAFELLMADVSSKNAERRRCSRRVLQDALVERKDTESAPEAEAWMFAVPELQHAKALVPIAVKQMVRLTVLFPYCD